MTPTPERIPLSDLPEDEQVRIHALDISAEELTAVRSRIADELAKNRTLLRRKPGKKGRPGAYPDRIEMAETIRDAGVEDTAQLEKAATYVDPGKVARRAEATGHTVSARSDVLQELAADDAAESLRSIAMLEEERAALEEKLGDHAAMRREELKLAVDMITGKERTIRGLEEKLAARVSVAAAARGTDERASRSIAKLRESLRVARVELDRSIHGDPDVYVAVRTKQLRDIKEAFDSNGTIVETPYVRETLNYVLDAARRNEPILLFGELGSGKTEVSKHAARRYLSIPAVRRWEALNPAPKSTGKIDADNAARRSWEARRRTEAEEPVIVSGHKEMQTVELLAERVVRMREMPPPEERMHIINEKWNAYAITNSIDLTESTIEHEFKTLYAQSFEHPMETFTAVAGVYKAMKEGRPLLIDEMNAIPHSTLIVLNDLLTYKPGQTVTPSYPADAAPFVVQEGYCVIATGNWKPEEEEGGATRYVQRQTFDAAFISRWELRKFDYLPNPPVTDEDRGDPDKLRRKNCERELYLMIMGRLLDARLGAVLPEGALQKLAELARAGRELQDVFSGTAGGTLDITHADGRVTPQNRSDILRENVLSLRHLTKVLEAWRASGCNGPLDAFLYDYYVTKSDARPSEKQLIYGVLQSHGFFPDAKGWPLPNETMDTQKMARIVARLKDEPAPMRTYSRLELIEALFGPVPLRTHVLRRTEKPSTGIEIGTMSPEELEERIRLAERIAHLQSTFLGVEADGSKSPDFPFVEVADA